MAQILQNKNLATKFQILAEVATNQPNIQQKLIATRIGVTSQAVSEYVRELLKEGFIVSDGRSRYKVTKEGVDWVLRMSRELQDYSSFVGKAITKATVCAAIAECDLSQGQAVGLKMIDGALCASETVGKEARGMAISNARAGEDVGVSNIEGIVELKIGTTTIVKVPGIEKGGSKGTDFSKLKESTNRSNLIAAVGIEALCALRGIGISPDYFYGVEEAIVEAAFSGISPTVVCVDEQISTLLQRLEGEGLGYEMIDLAAPVN